MARTAKIITMLGLLALCGTAWGVEPIPNLIAHWTFDEGSGDIAYDSAGSNHGTIYGAEWTTGQIEGALSFDGVDDYVDLDAHIGDFQNLSTGTLSAWINNIEDESGVFFSASRSDAVTEIYFQILPDGRLKIRICPLDPPGSLLYWISDDILPSGWHQFAYTTSTNPSGNWMYLDGERIFGDYTKGNPSTNAFFSHVHNQDNLRIGNIRSRGMEDRGHFNGLIDDVRIYDRALSSEEIEELHEDGLDKYELAVTNIQRAIAEKAEALERIVVGLQKEWAAYSDLEELLESGDYGDLKKGDIVKTKQNIHSAIQYEQQCKDKLEKSIEKLEDALAMLGWEPPFPVSHWKFDEDSGDIAYDSTGNNHGIVYGAVWTTGQIEGALSFDGDNDYVEVATFPNLSDVITVTGWFKFMSLLPEEETRTIVAKADNNGDNAGFTLHLKETTDNIPVIRFIINDDDGGRSDISTSQIDVDTWYFVAASYDGIYQNIYLNGYLVSSIENSGRINPAKSNLLIGRSDDRHVGGPVYFHGLIDEVAIYDSVLSPEEVRLLYYNRLD